MSSAYPPVRLANCVGTVSLGSVIDLEEVAWECHSELDRRKFAACLLRSSVNGEKTTALLFQSGKMVVTGATTEISLHEAVIHYYTRICNAIPHSIRDIACLNVKIQNIVAFGFLGSNIDLTRASQKYNICSSYCPEQFPGLRLKIQTFQVKALVFLSGRAVITGIRASHEVELAWKALCDLMRPFFIVDKQNHVEIVATRQRQRATLIEDDLVTSTLHKKLKSSAVSHDDIDFGPLSMPEDDEDSDDEILVSAAFEKLAEIQ